MKKYIIMTPSIINMGGAQMYISNKVTWLQQNGWNVDVISAQHGQIFLQKLNQFSKVITELNFCNYLFRKRKQERIIKQVIEYLDVNSCSDIVIESTCIPISTWAELLAQRIGAKHISYLLQESNELEQGSNLIGFFVFKHTRKELVSITDTSLQMMFAPFHPIPLEKSYTLPAWCNNVEADVDNPFLHSIDWHKYDYKVGCLSRLDKPFVLPAIGEFVEFAKKHKEKSFILMLMGGATQSCSLESEIKELVSTSQNIHLVITGFLYPVPTKLLEACDAFFTSAGSAWVCMRTGVPTISYDGNDCKAIGVLGENTQSSLFRTETEPPIPLEVLLDKILIDKGIAKKIPSYYTGLPDFVEHINFIDDSAENQEYYELSFTPNTASDNKLKIMLALVGADKYIKLASLKLKFFKSKR